MLRSQAAFGSLTERFTHKQPHPVLHANEDNQMEHDHTEEPSIDALHNSSHPESFYEDPNYIPYNYAPDSYSQANLSQVDDRPTSIPYDPGYNQGRSSSNTFRLLSGEDSSMLTPQMSSSQSHLNLDDLDDLILDDADVEAELNEPLNQNVLRPFTPVQDIRMDDFWAQQPMMSSNAAVGFDYAGDTGQFGTVELYGGTYEDSEDGPVHEFYDPLDTISEFDPDRGMMHY